MKSLRFETLNYTMRNTQDYITSNKDRFLNELLNLLRIPSVSADSKYNDEVVKCANTLAEDLKKIVHYCQLEMLKMNDMKKKK